MVKDHSAREESCFHPYIGYSFRLAARDLYMHHPTDRIAHTMSVIHIGANLKFLILCIRIQSNTWLLAFGFNPSPPPPPPPMMDPLSYFLFQPVLLNWCNKGCGISYTVCGKMHIKEPLLLIRKSSP